MSNFESFSGSEGVPNTQTEPFPVLLSRAPTVPMVVGFCTHAHTCTDAQQRRICLTRSTLSTNVKSSAAKMRRCNSLVAVLLPLCRIAMSQLPHRSQVQAAAAQLKLGDRAADSDAKDDPGGDRRKRLHLRSQTKAKEEHERYKQTLKKVKVEQDADFLKSVEMMSPFVCHVPELSEQQRIKWAIEWTEHKTLSQLSTTFEDADQRAEIFEFLGGPMKQNALCTYFGIKQSTFFKYLAKYRGTKEAEERVAKLQPPLVRQEQAAGSSSAHASSMLLDMDAEHDGDTPAGLQNLEFKHAGRQAAFSEDTLHAAKVEFAARVTGPKRGMTCEAMVEMLIRLRQLHQAQPFEVLPWPSTRTIMAAIEQLEVEGMKAHFTNPSRARALEDWRNAINCVALWWAVMDCGIDKSLLFGVDEVSVLLEAGRKPRMMYLPKGMAKACRRRNLAPASVQVDPKKRMAHMMCMTNAEGDLAATVVKIADHTVADGKIFLKFVSKGLWVAFVNPKVPKPQYSRAILVNCLLPTIHQRQKDAAVHLNATPSAADVHSRPNLKDPSGVTTRAAAAAAAAAALSEDSTDSHRFTSPQQTQSQGIRLSQYTGEFFRPTVEHSNLPRAVLTFDGAHEQIEAVLSEDVAEWCIEHNIALFKWAAACSLVQQPNDVSRCHKILHRLFASSKYLYMPVKKESIRTCLYPVIAMLNSLPKLAKDSKLTFTKFFCNLHDILHDAFRPEVVRRGWADAGIHPFSVEQIMSGWNHGATKTNKSWTMLEPEYKQFCLTAISKLREPARSGQLLDAAIENVIVREAVPDVCTELTLLGAMTLAEAGDPEYMKVHIVGMQRRSQCVPRVIFV
jgi:hypothetical protein